MPDDGVVQRLAAKAVPEQHRLALVGNADCQGLALRRDSQSIADGMQDGLPYLFGIVLHPTGLRIVLSNLPVAARPHETVMINE